MTKNDPASVGIDVEVCPSVRATDVEVRPEHNLASVWERPLVLALILALGCVGDIGFEVRKRCKCLVQALIQHASRELFCFRQGQTAPLGPS